jgi:hypothetical protein
MWLPGNDGDEVCAKNVKLIERLSADLLEEIDEDTDLDTLYEEIGAKISLLYFINSTDTEDLKNPKILDVPPSFYHYWGFLFAIFLNILDLEKQGFLKKSGNRWVETEKFKQYGTAK